MAWIQASSWPWRSWSTRIHAEALRLLGELLARGDRVAIAPQVLTEFVHVVTDVAAVSAAIFDGD